MNIKIKIPCSPEVQALKRAVEDADRLTEYRFDTLGLWQLVEILEYAGWSGLRHWQVAALALRDAGVNAVAS